LRPRLGLKPMVISVSNHGRRVVKSGTPSSTSGVSAVTSLVHSKHRTWWHRPTQAESTKLKSRPTLVIQKIEPCLASFTVEYIHGLRSEIPFWRDPKRGCRNLKRNAQCPNGRTLQTSYIFCTSRQRSAPPVCRVGLTKDRDLRDDELVPLRVCTCTCLPLPDLWAITPDLNVACLLAQSHP